MMRSIHEKYHKHLEEAVVAAQVLSIRARPLTRREGLGLKIMAKVMKKDRENIELDFGDA